MRTAVLSLAALAAAAATADAQYVVRRGVVYAPTYPGYYAAPQYVVPAAPVVVPVAPTVIVPAATGTVVVPAATGTVVMPAAPAVVGYGYYPAYRYPGWRWR